MQPFSIFSFNHLANTIDFVTIQQHPTESALTSVHEIRQENKVLLLLSSQLVPIWSTAKQLQIEVKARLFVLFAE